MAGSESGLRNGTVSVFDASLNFWTDFSAQRQLITPPIGGWGKADAVAFGIYYKFALEHHIDFFTAVTWASGFAGAWSKYCYDKYGY